MQAPQNTLISPQNYSARKIPQKYFPNYIDSYFKTDYIIIIDNDNIRKFKHNR